MKVINIHKREVQQSKAEIAKLFRTLSTDNDLMLATDKWPPMKLDNGLSVGSKGGHGPIRYSVADYQPEKLITFQFDLTGFNGFHRFSINELEPAKSITTWTPILVLVGHSNKLLGKLECRLTWAVGS